MIKSLFNIILIVGFFLSAGPGLAGVSQDPVQAGEKDDTLYPPAAVSKPKIDGNLDDETWQTPPLIHDFITYEPVFGDTLPYETQVRMTYDSNNLYFAFKCSDSDPQKIKTSLTGRDKMWGDDWVGLTLDSTGNKQSTYGFCVNPNGIQGDLLESTSNPPDLAPDFVWESAGKLTSTGYQVEICIPLKSIRFESGKKVDMGIMFRRKVSRLGVKASWPEQKPGEGVFNRLMPVRLNELKKLLKLEILPSITYSSNREKIQPEVWGDRQDLKQFGIGLKYGITSSITADITFNPDFSQVESDAFQVEVNQRYPLFYSEKRPFFMEGADIFSFFTAAAGFLPYAVYTRRIMNPSWGGKLTGTLGKASFGILSAGDEWPGQSWETGANPDEGKQAFFGVVRGKYSLGKDNYIGLLYSGREFAGQYNRVTGADLGYRLFKDHKINVSFLQSDSEEGENDQAGGDDLQGKSVHFMYSYITEPLLVQTTFEHIGAGFKMDSAYLKRTGIDQSVLKVEYSFFPKSGKQSWLKRISPGLQFNYLHDLETKLNDSIVEFSLGFNFIGMGNLRLAYNVMKESWLGDTFDLNLFRLTGGIQVTKWLEIAGDLSIGDSIYYEAEPAYKGKANNGSLSLTFQPNRNINQQFQFFYAHLSKDKKEIYDLNIYYSRTTYQFSKYFFLRGIVQYDNFQKRLLTDFLASFTLIPGTVFHAGYGSLYEGREWRNNDWVLRRGDLIHFKRSFFLKVSYLWRF